MVVNKVVERMKIFDIYKKVPKNLQDATYSGAISTLFIQFLLLVLLLSSFWLSLNIVSGPITNIVLIFKWLNIHLTIPFRLI